MTHLYGHVGHTLLVSVLLLLSCLRPTQGEMVTYQHLSLDSSSTPIVKLLEQYGQNNIVRVGWRKSVDYIFVLDID